MSPSLGIVPSLLHPKLSLFDLSSQSPLVTLPSPLSAADRLLCFYVPAPPTTCEQLEAQLTSNPQTLIPSAGTGFASEEMPSNCLLVE